MLAVHVWTLGQRFQPDCLGERPQAFDALIVRRTWVFLKNRSGLERVSRSHAAGPGPNRRIAPAVRMKHGERVRGSRLTVYGDQHATTGGQGLEYSSIVRLKTDAPQRSRQPELRQIASGALQRGDQRSFDQQRPSRGGLDLFAGSAERRYDQRVNLGTFFRNDAERFRRQTGFFQRVNSLLRPLHVLEHRNRKTSSIYVDHGHVIYHGGSRRPEVGG